MQKSFEFKPFFHIIPGALPFPVSAFSLALQRRVFVEIFTFAASTVHQKKLSGRGRSLAFIKFRLAISNLSSERFLAASTSSSAIRILAFLSLVGVTGVDQRLPQQGFRSRVQVLRVRVQGAVEKDACAVVCWACETLASSGLAIARHIAISVSLVETGVLQRACICHGARDIVQHLRAMHRTDSSSGSVKVGSP